MRITTATEAAQRDADAIASGTDSWALMLAAGTAAARFIREIIAPFESRAIRVTAGTGNNGGDAYVVAAELLNAGETVSLSSRGEPRTADAQRAKGLYEAALASCQSATDNGTEPGSCQFFGIDGLLGTGQQGALRPAERQLTDRMNALRAEGMIVIALDVPTGVNATTGEVAEGAIEADYTLALGTMKRAHVLERAQCGEICVLDIGLGLHAEKDDGAWTLADEALLLPKLPRIAWNAHKGMRGRLAIVGGTRGMGGAVVLAAEAATRAGVGLVHTYVHPESVLPLQISVAQAICHEWSETPAGMHAIALGPGLGRTQESANVLLSILAACEGVPVVLDADALWHLSSHIGSLRRLAEKRRVVCTPHPVEFARLIGEKCATSIADRVEQQREFCRNTGATILLKGTPTIVMSPENPEPIVIPRGNAALATGGSGDMLTGIIGTLLAQGSSPLDAATIGAWIHGRAAEIAVRDNGSVRGTTLHDVLRVMPQAWQDLTDNSLKPDVLAWLPRVSFE